MQSILISLGHNSSAVGINNDSMVGYEEERISRKKSSSAFPKEAIERVMKHLDLNDPDKRIYISHWFDDAFGIITNLSAEQIKAASINDSEGLLKHYDADFIIDMKSKGWKIHTVGEKCSHHDAHAYSAWWFFKSTINPSQQALNEKSKRKYIFVADGFGNRREVLSVYKIDDDNNSITKVSSKNGYSASLGLLYQYATAFTGMKENEDEYKFLGYESHIKERIATCSFTSESSSKEYAQENVLNIIKTNAFNLASTLFNKKGEFDNFTLEDLYIKVEDLSKAREYFYCQFRELIFNIRIRNYIDIKDLDHFTKRAIIGHFIQSVVEQYMLMLIDWYKPTTLITAGGLFYNVKLNNAMARKVIGKSYDRETEMTHGLYCVMPIAGDQGAPFGLYYSDVYKNENVAIPKLNNFLIGERDKHWNSEFEFVEYFKQLKATKLGNLVTELAQDGEVSAHYANYIAIANGNILPALNAENTVRICNEMLADDKIPQVVRGNMEFGPRALCNTSSILNASAENVELINNSNGRNTVMPMAPIVLEEMLSKCFPKTGGYDYRGIVGSLKYMIITLDWDSEFSNNKDLYALHSGVMHKYPLEEAYSGRPQVVTDDMWIAPVLKEAYKKFNRVALINTSYNVHGVPIVFSASDAVDDYLFQVKKVILSDKTNDEKIRLLNKLALIIEMW